MPSRETGESTAKYLKRLEDSGNWLFHGSGIESEIGELEPREAYCATGAPERNQCAVFVTDKVAHAMQMAILGAR